MDQLFKIKNNDYSAFQKVTLKPGDTLYIPSGWYHSIFYLTPCIGVAQYVNIETDK